jgi:glycosyltransferase A (GT-A) superfamily protein (DUF2064 family)
VPSVIAPRLQSAQRVSICVLLPPPARDLEPVLGREGAQCLGRAFFDDTWSSVSALPWADATTTMVDEPDAGRLERLLSRALERGEPALAVFADGPGVPRLLLDRARVGLGRADAVLGPREGGGLYLAGLSRPAPGVWDGISLADRDAFDRARDRLRASGYTVEVLAPWLGAANPADLRRLRRALERGEVRAPATARRLERPRVSLVLALGDDQHRVASELGHLTRLPGLYELIAVDGDSHDRTRSIARRFPVRFLRSRAGRAAANNTGARAATGDVVWFVPPGVLPPQDAVSFIADALVDPGTVGGAFRTWTVPDAWRPWFTPLLHAPDLALRLGQLPRADQALFARTAAFRAAGGFSDLAAGEDVELAWRLRDLGRLFRVPADVLVSSEHLHQHPLRHAAAVALAPLLVRAGLPDRLLARALGA